MEVGGGLQSLMREPQVRLWVKRSRVGRGQTGEAAFRMPS